MRRVTRWAALVVLSLIVTGAATADQVNGKHTTPGPPGPPCAVESEALLSPSARRTELALLRARLLLIREEELARLRSRLEAQLQERERRMGTQGGDRTLNLP